MNDQEDSNVNTRLWGGDSLGDYNSEWLNMLSKKFSFQGKIIRQIKNEESVIHKGKMMARNTLRKQTRC